MAHGRRMSSLQPTLAMSGVIEVIKEPFDVQINHPFALPAPLPYEDG